LATLVELSGSDRTTPIPAPTPTTGPARAAVDPDGPGRFTARVVWPDGFHTSTQISEDGAVTPVAP
jgi:hypothetical protein